MAQVIKNWIVPITVFVSILGMNVYRLFPVAEGEAKLGDRVYYVIQAVSWILIIQALRWKRNSRRDEIILAGFFSLALNGLLFELFGQGSEITWQHYLIGGTVTVITCLRLMLRWYWMIAMVCAVLLLLSI